MCAGGSIKVLKTISIHANTMRLISYILQTIHPTRQPTIERSIVIYPTKRLSLSLSLPSSRRCCRFRRSCNDDYGIGNGSAMKALIPATPGFFKKLEEQPKQEHGLQMMMMMILRHGVIVALYNDDRWGMQDVKLEDHFVVLSFSRFFLFPTPYVYRVLRVVFILQAGSTLLKFALPTVVWNDQPKVCPFVRPPLEFVNVKAKGNT